VVGWGAGVESRLGSTKTGACARIGGAAIALYRMMRDDVARINFARVAFAGMLTAFRILGPPFPWIPRGGTTL
jgi:hypothetical protein